MHRQTADEGSRSTFAGFTVHCDDIWVKVAMVLGVFVKEISRVLDHTGQLAKGGRVVVIEWVMTDTLELALRYRRSLQRLNTR